MKLIIVESPTKSKTISKLIKGDFEIIASVGHIRDLPKSKFGVEIILKNKKYKFKPTYVIDPKKSKIISKLKSAVKSADEIYMATDPDREGEAIAYHITKVVDTKKKIQRISFHEITQSAIEKAMEKPGKIDMDLVNAQQARRVLDRIVGYTLSPLLWKKIRRGLSAGRVQSIAVRLIVEREREIKKFKPENYFNLLAKPEHKKDFVLSLNKVDNKSINKRKKYDLFTGFYTTTKTILDNNKKVTDIINNLSENFVITDIKKHTVKKSPPPPFTTSKLQQNASWKFGWSAKYTMRVAQSLFEKGLITYHRTDSTFLSPKATKQIRELIKKDFGEKYLPGKTRFYKTKSKLAQEAHEAIRPTDASNKEHVISNKLDKREAKLYELIWQRAVSCQMANAKLAKTKVELTPGKTDKYLFTCNGSQVIFDGFSKVYPVKFSENLLPELKKGQKLKVNNLGATKHATTPPPRYNEASLIAELEKHGIGRPSTYASIISTIQSRNYVEKEDRKFKPTIIGNVVTDFLVKHFSKLMELPFTANLEDSLDDIAKGKEKWQPILSDFWGPFNKTVEEVTGKADRVKIPTPKIGKKCPKCKRGDLVIRTGKYGKFISCNRFPDCKYTEPYNNKAGFECPKCGAEAIIKKTKKGRKFFSCSRWPKCDWSSWKKPKGA